MPREGAMTIGELIAKSANIDTPFCGFVAAMACFGCHIKKIANFWQGDRMHPGFRFL